MAIEVLNPDAAPRWPWATLMQKWAVMQTQMTHHSCTDPTKLPPLYKHNYDVLSAEIARRGCQLRLWD